MNLKAQVISGVVTALAIAFVFAILRNWQRGQFVNKSGGFVVTPQRGKVM